MDTVIEPVFSSRRAGDLAGVRGHQLHAWAAAEVAVPSIDPGYRQGRPKKWAFSDVVGIRILRELISAGMCPPMLGNLLPALRRFTLDCPGLPPLAAANVVIYGNGDVTVAADVDQLCALLRNSTGTILRALVIELGPVVREVEKAMRRAQLHEDLELLEDAVQLFTAA